MSASRINVPLTLDTTKASLQRRVSPNSPSTSVAAHGLGFCRLLGDALSGQTRSGEDLRQERLRPRLGIHAFVYRQGSTGDGHRIRRHARLELVPAIFGPRRCRNGQPAGRQSPMGDQPRRFSIRQLHPQLYSFGVQPGRGRAHGVGRRQPAHRGAAPGAEFSFRRRRRVRGALPAGQRRSPLVE